MAMTLMAYANNAMTHVKPASAAASTNVCHAAMQTPSHMYLGNAFEIQDITTPVTRLLLLTVRHEMQLVCLARTLDQILERSATRHISDNPLPRITTEWRHALMAMVLTSRAKIESSVMTHVRPVTEELALIDLHVLILVSLLMMRVNA